MTTYLVIGVYPDGITRSHRVTTADIGGYAARLTRGFLPFARVNYVPCPHDFTVCDCAAFL